MTTKSEIELWLKEILSNEDLEDFSVELEGNTESGSGYVGDIFFLTLSGTTKSKTRKTLNLVVKVGKRNEALRSKFPINSAFLNEIYFYRKIYPTLLKFQQEKNVEVFDKIPKCFGCLTKKNVEVIVFENLRAQGFSLWDKKEPLIRQQFEAMLKEYARFHAVSIALKDQKPEEFKELAKGFDEVFGKLLEFTDMLTTFEDLVDEIYEMLQGELDEKILEKWKSLRGKVRPFMKSFRNHLEGVNVIVHGDCWTNNFMHKIIDGKPVSFAILDWQMAKASSPAVDISYFFFACLSEKDILEADKLLKLYHDTLSDCVRKMGSNPEKLYPFEDFQYQWKNHSKFGILLTNLIHKFAMTDGAEVPDFGKAAEEGHDITKSMAVKIKDTPRFKNRMKYLVRFAAENDLI